MLFGATYPLAMIGPRLAARGIPYLAAAHGFEYWLSVMPGAHSLMRYATSKAARVPVMCSAFIARTVRTAVPARVPVSVLYPGADIEAFRPDLPTDDLRERHGVGDRPLVVCVSRLVARKGQDVLIEGMDEVRRRVPDATLLIVGGGPYEDHLRDLAGEAPRRVGDLRGAGLRGGPAPATTPWGTCSRCHAGRGSAAWRSRAGGTSSSRPPRAGGRSSWAIRAAPARRSSTARPASSSTAPTSRRVADAVAALLGDPALARRMGEAGRARVERSHTWPAIAERLVLWLQAAAS